MIPRLPLSSISQCKLTHHDDRCIEIFQALAHFEPTYIESQQTSKTICKVRSLKSRIKTVSFLAEIITSSSEIFKNVESDIVVGINKLGNPTQVTAESIVIVQWNMDFEILSLELHRKKFRSVKHCMHICEVEYNDRLKRLTAYSTVYEQCNAIHCCVDS
jgi:hypothetical protein